MHANTFGKKYFWEKYCKKILLGKVLQKNTFGKSIAKKYFWEKYCKKYTFFIKKYILKVFFVKLF